MSLGMLVRRLPGSATAPVDPGAWAPEPLGSRLDVMFAIAAAMPADPEEAAALELVLRVEPPEENPEPRSITVEGRFGERERAVLAALCEALDARFFDADHGDFLRF